MPHYLLVQSRGLPGRETEYRSWYLDTHLADVLAVPGFLGGQLHACLGADGEPTGNFNALYEVDPAVAPGALLADLSARSATMKLTDAIDPASVTFTFLVPQ